MNGLYATVTICSLLEQGEWRHTPERAGTRRLGAHRGHWAKGSAWSPPSNSIRGLKAPSRRVCASMTVSKNTRLTPALRREGSG